MNTNNNTVRRVDEQPRVAAERAVDAYVSGGSKDFESLFDYAPQPMWLYDLATLRFLRVNRAAISSYGYSEDEFLAMTIEDLRPPEDLNRLREHIHEQRRKSPDERAIVSPYWRHILKDGRIIWVDIFDQLFRYEGRDAGLIVAADVTVRKLTQERFEIQRAYFRQLFDSSSEAILLLDKHDTIVDANQRFLKLFGYDLPEVIGRCIEQLIVPDERRFEVQQKRDAIRLAGYLYRETQRKRKDGVLLDVTVTAYPIKYESEQLGAYLLYNDMTEKKRLLEKVRYHSTHNPSSGLMNRKAFESQLRTLLRRKAGSDRCHVLLHVALDQFMLVNRTCGQQASKRLLKQVTDFIRARMGSDQIAHLYGDEFGILLSDTRPEDAQNVARALADDIAAIVFRWNDQVYRIGANIGGIMLRASTDARKALSLAEMACQVAKEKGPNKIHLAEIDDQETVRRRHEVHWLSEIHEALESGRFVLYAQQIVPIARESGKSYPYDYEILVRMLDQNGNIVPPGQFIPVAERFRLMAQVDRQVLSHLFHMLGDRADGKAGFHGRVCVNLSGETLGDEEFSDYIKKQFQRYHVAPENICFEVTETAAIQNIDAAARFVSDMQSMGAKIALDDFGSGMSSFRYLRELPIDYLKIDGLFIREILDNDTDRAMTEAISRMAQALGIGTIAECVEDPKVLACLRELNIDYAQGFAIHRPEPLTLEMLGN
ncbi:MAG TPA: EAL domain-containing protein [Gammaproteobacteria bacterium]|nr:EAL domain-containing protein [Gammaproteobacteria bacterium]